MINHGFCEDLKDVAKKSITAGIDMEMQRTTYADHLEALVKGGDSRSGLKGEFELIE